MNDLLKLLRGLIRWQRENRDLVVVLSGLAFALISLAGWCLGLVRIRNYWIFIPLISIAGFSVLWSMAKLGWFGKHRAARLWWREGDRNRRLGLHEAAIRCFKKAHYFNPGYPIPQIESRVDPRTGEKKPIYIWPRLSEYDRLIGEAGKYLDLDDYKAAISILQRAIESEPQRPEAYLALALIYSGRHDDEALDYSTKAVEVAPAHKEAHFLRGKFLLYLYCNPEKAIEDFDQAIGLDENYAAAYALRAHAHHLQGDIEAAKRDFKKAQKLRSKSADIKQVMKLLARELRTGQRKSRLYTQL